jgi:hypothetical protein
MGFHFYFSCMKKILALHCNIKLSHFLLPTRLHASSTQGIGGIKEWDIDQHKALNIDPFS